MTTRRLWLIVPWAIFAVLAIGWVAYWLFLAGEIERHIETWRVEQTQQGAQVSIGRIVRHGFPAMMRFELRAVSYAPAQGGWRVETERVDLHVQPLNTEHLIAEAEAPIAVSRANGAVTNISADALIASLRTDDGALAQAGVEADNLVLDDPAQEGVFAARKVVVNVRPDARAAGQYQLAFDAQTMTLPRPVRSFEAFGLDVAHLRAAIVIEAGDALLTAAQNDPLGPWRDAGGRLRFEAISLAWGALETTATGQGGLDTERRLVGEFEAPINTPGPVLSAIANGPSVDETTRRALAMLAAGYTLTGGDIELEFEARDGVLRLQDVPIRPLPPVY